jgi:peptide/nickel transport system permease protein
MRFYIERTLRAIFTIWMAMTITFGLIRLIPSGPIEQMRVQIVRTNPQLTPAQVQSRLQDRADRLGLDLDAPLHQQYVDYMFGLLQGDLGMSFQESEPVARVLGEAMPWTLFYVTTATVLVFAVAVIWGAILAYKEGSLFDSASSSVSILASTIPSYVLAFVLLLVFSYRLGWLPARGKTSPLMQADLASLTFLVDAFKHSLLLIASVFLTQVGLQVLAMRGNSIQILGEDYVRVARLRGLADRRIATRYVARNAILPLYTGFLTLIGFNLGASIVLEQVFRYQGLGWYMFLGLENRDYPLVMGTFLVYTLALVLAVFIADLTYSRIDPRVKQGDTSEAY